MKHHHSVMGHGSPMATHKMHGGKVAGAGELRVGAGGTNPFKVRPEMSASQFQGGAKTSGKVKGIKTYSEE